MEVNYIISLNNIFLFLVAGIFELNITEDGRKYGGMRNYY